MVNGKKHLLMNVLILGLHDLQDVFSDPTTLVFGRDQQVRIVDNQVSVRQRITQTN